jgi:ribosome-binding factor A
MTHKNTARGKVMASYKNARAAEDVRRELTDIFRGIKDPRASGLISIVGLELSSDYSHCKVMISSMDGLSGAKQAVEGLKNASGHIRREIGARLRLRRTPEFHFIADDGIEYSAGIGKKMQELGLGGGKFPGGEGADAD